MPKFEQYANNAADTLNGTINDSVTSLVVNSAAEFPTDGNFRILINTEIMLVTAVSGTTFTVVRGAESTTATSHLNTDVVTLILTEESLKRVVSDYYPYFAGITNDVGPLNSLTDASGTTLDSTDFTAVNAGTSAFTDLGSGLSLVPQMATGTNLRMYVRTAPSPPYTIYAAVSLNLFPAASPSHGGLCFRESGTSKVKVCGLGSDTGDALELKIGDFTDASTFSAWDLDVPYAFNPGLVWISITDDNSNIEVGFSNNGFEFCTVFSELRSSWFTTAPDQVGLYFNTNSTTAQGSLLCSHWSEQ